MEEVSGHRVRERTVSKKTLLGFVLLVHMFDVTSDEGKQKK